MPTFVIREETACEANVADPASTFSGIRRGGRTDMSVFRNAEPERPRAEFSLAAQNRSRAFLIVARMLVALTDAAPLLGGGWVLLSRSAGVADMAGQYLSKPRKGS
jgi:hypothetical protein